MTSTLTQTTKDSPANGSKSAAQNTPKNSFNVPKEKVKNPPLTIHKLGDRVLRQPAKRVSKVNDEIRRLCADMLITMYSSDGIGLAAPQVGVNKQVIVIDIELKDQSQPPLILINPEIKGMGGAMVTGEEGCLSIPEVFLDVVRPDEVEVVYRDEDGKPQRLMANGLLARGGGDPARDGSSKGSDVCGSGQQCQITPTRAS